MSGKGTVPGDRLLPVTSAGVRRLSPRNPPPRAGPVPLLEHLRPPEPLSRRELGVLALLATIAFGQGWAGNVLTHTLPFTREGFGLSDQGIADVQAIVRSVALLALVFSWWGDNRGRRGPLLFAFFLLPAANLATAFAPNLTTFATFQGVARIGTIAIGSLALVVLAEEMNPTVRGYAAAVYALFLSMGTGFGLLISPLGDTGDDGWRLLFGVGTVPLLVLPVLMLRLRESRAFRPGRPRPSIGALLRSGTARYFWALAGLSFVIAAFSAPAANFILPHMVNDLGWPQSKASLLLVLVSTPAVVIGLLAGGRIADTVGRKPTEVVAMLVGAAGGVCFYLFDNGWVLGTAIFVSILGSSALAPAFTAHRSEVFPTGIRATATAWIVNAAIFGGLGGFLAGRFVVNAIGLAGMMTMLGLLVVAATGLVALLPETRGISLIEDEGEADSPDPGGAMPV